VDRARELLLYSDRPILDVAVATGFATTSHFAQWFRVFHAARPSELRARAMAASAAG
jgi:transcriptional regulator GlxA family with amidase domain